MYGLVNKGLGEMVQLEAGEAAWTEIRRRAGVDVSVFVTHQGYPDDVSVRLVVATAELLERSVERVLEDFGRHWILHTARAYGPIVEATGRTVPEFLCNLPNLHTRVSLSFPHLRPPEFRCRDVTSTGLVLEYRSGRSGFAPFVVGLLHGLAERFGTTIDVSFRAIDEHFYEFFVSWKSAE